MLRKILVLNSGSSSVKFRLFGWRSGEECHALVSDVIERIGEHDGQVQDHRQALRMIVSQLGDEGHLGDSELMAIGHRVVHGGETFSQAAVVDNSVKEAIKASVTLAPLHNPANLLGIEACEAIWPSIPQVAVFDTAFHQTLPPEAFRYPIPDSAYRKQGVRRYGFHGSSFAYVTRRAASYLHRSTDSLNLVILHLGNGASACAIQNGKSIETSMGMTPMAGLMMGTRCGDLDPGIIFFWCEQLGFAPKEVFDWLNRSSGLMGIAGTNDMRDVLDRAAQGQPNARLALDMYIHRLRLYLGAYRALLPNLDALIFTGGIGEHAAQVRAAACRDQHHLGFYLDEKANAMISQGVAEIQTSNADIKIMVIPTDEEAEIAQQTLNLIPH
ncbi:MAG: acetate/propionate family kinase [Methylococcus sp.]